MFKTKYRRIFSLILATALALMLTGCQLLGLGSSPDSSESAPASESVPAPESTSVPEPASVSEPAEHPDDDQLYEGGYPEAPAGPHTALTADTLDQLNGDWVFWPNGEENEPGGTVWQFRFGEPTAEYMMVSAGIYQTGTGIFYRGTWALDTPGILTAKLQVSEMGDDTPDLPVVTVEFRAKWAGEPGEMLMLTMMSYQCDDGDTFADFGYAFSEMFNKTLPTYHAW